jgi:hypothetical protein
MDLASVDPEVVFTPRRKRLEGEFVEEERKVINNLDIPPEEKEFMKEKLWKYYLEFQRNYSYYYHKIRRETRMYNALTELNKRMDWNSN